MGTSRDRPRLGRPARAAAALISMVVLGLGCMGGAPTSPAGAVFQLYEPDGGHHVDAEFYPGIGYHEHSERGSPGDPGGEDGFEPVYRAEDRLVAEVCSLNARACRLITREHRVGGHVRLYDQQDRRHEVGIRIDQHEHLLWAEQNDGDGFGGPYTIIDNMLAAACDATTPNLCRRLTREYEL